MSRLGLGEYTPFVMKVHAAVSQLASSELCGLWGNQSVENFGKFGIGTTDRRNPFYTGPWVHDS